SGVGLARGYMNNPELTAEKFDRDLWDFQDYQDKKRKENYQKFFGGSRGAILQKSPPGRRRLFKTGDLARWLPEGNIEFLGRLDQQVKIRGYRVELGEIENSLVALAGIKEAVVITRSGENNEKYLCAYVETKNKSDINVSLLKQKLSTRLPDFMIPSRFMKVDQIPLTPNKKKDYKALLELETFHPHGESVYLAPVTGMEKLIANTWQEVLNLDKIGVNDNFFDLGGNSLNLVKVIIKLKKILNKEIPTMMMFHYPTVRLLAHYIMEEGEKQTIISTTEQKAVLEKLDKRKERLKTTRKKMK
ncbi:MAG: AMP-binding protein, partial [Candidatus Aminicenantes bacterium]|nr:AMP-binding protein [Candidatus Aminicenantes bacterium]NIM77441.1 AMP-binding protein [Candidatus Aminicenantes bacterium]NIN19534.1 AMP-binding protein [Candidatus Aminicenantes bacterium]NIN43428.1 AMP-binding protein [Candidatus Aminicenantes bacterium]NIN86173.1 AMP-binding protein [Candidatus Aminicenantes bacterium]